MCGRYSLAFDEEFYTRYRVTNRLKVKPNYNVAPGQTMPVVVSHSPNSMELMVWGLVPFWEEKKEKPHGLINVRDDTILAKPWAHKYIQFQRCLVPATGFYEWKRTTEDKVPYYFHLPKEKYYAFAGVYGVRTDPATNKQVNSYAIITTSPNGLMSGVHNRMPVILRPEDEDRWLSHDMVEVEHIKEFLKPYPDRQMEAHPVSKRVNSPRENDASIVSAIVLQ